MKGVDSPVVLHTNKRSAFTGSINVEPQPWKLFMHKKYASEVKHCLVLVVSWRHIEARLRDLS